MRIIYDNRERDIRRFGSLEIGECFALPKGDTVYMKGRSHSGEYTYAINLANGRCYTWERDKEVVVVEAELHVCPTSDC